MPKSLVCKLAIVVGGIAGSNDDHDADVLAVTSETQLRTCKDPCQNKVCVILQMLLVVTLAAKPTMTLMFWLLQARKKN